MPFVDHGLTARLRQRSRLHRGNEKRILLEPHLEIA
jgi:hypothetical protein